jgi:hypothetical protein
MQTVLTWINHAIGEKRRLKPFVSLFGDVVDVRFQPYHTMLCIELETHSVEFKSPFDKPTYSPCRSCPELATLCTLMTARLASPLSALVE